MGSPAQPPVTEALLVPAGQVMSRPPVFVPPEVTLRSLAEAMAVEGVGALLVMGPDLPPRLVTERDVVHALARGADVDAVATGEIASERLVTVGPDDTLLEVAQLMAAHHVRHVVVESGSGVVGVISARDLLQAFVAT